MTRPPRVLVAGAFGQGNPGDESVLQAFLSHLEGCDVTATVSGDPGASPPHRVVRSDDPLAVARAVASSDLTVVTATVFKVLHPSSGRPATGLLVNTTAMALAARTLARPVAMVGVGAGELPGRRARMLARTAVALAGPIEVRDEESAAALNRAGVGRSLPVGADVVWATLPPRRPRRRRPVVVMALSHLAGGPDLVAALQATAADLVTAGYEVALQPWQMPKDLSMAARVAAGAGVPVRIWDRPADVAEAAAGFEGVALVVGLRFHSLVAAGAAGAPFVAVAHEPKLAALARRFGQEAVLPGAPPDRLVAAARRALHGPQPARARVERERQLAGSALSRARALAFARAAGRGRALARGRRPAGDEAKVASSAVPG